MVELLSPANKQAGPDREQYLAKRMEILNGPVHLVEIDLLRGGSPMPADGPPQVLVLGPGQPGRAASRRRVLADLAPRAIARDPGAGPCRPIPTPGSTCKRSWTGSTTMRAMRDYIYEGMPRPRLGKKDADRARQFLPGPSS